MPQSIRSLLKGVVPKPIKARDLLFEHSNANCLNIVDLGCGVGNASDYIKEYFPNSSYLGLDIESSAEVNSRTRSDVNFESFDGVNILKDNNSIDILYCVQVFEHVRHPEKLLSEIFRVLKSNGLFIGSVSYLEPFHSNSIFNYTPYGWVQILNDAGLSLLSLRPGVEGPMLIDRSFINKTQSIAWEEKNIGEYYLNILSTNQTDLEKAELMLQYSGHIVFEATKEQINT